MLASLPPFALFLSLLIPPAHLPQDASSPALERFPVPEQATLRAASELLQGAFPGLDEAKEQDEGEELVAQLRAMAAETDAGTAEHFVLLAAIADVAARCALVDDAAGAVALQGQNYEVSSSELFKARWIELVEATDHLDGETRAEVLVEAERVAIDHIHATILARGEVQLGPWIDAAQVVSRARRHKTSRDLLKRLEDALDRDDATPAAEHAKTFALESGAFLCLACDDWGAGLDRIAKGSHAELAALVVQERATSDRTGATADAWWEAGKTLEPRRLRPLATQRARVLYEALLPELTGLVAGRAQVRIQEASAGPKTKKHRSKPKARSSRTSSLRPPTGKQLLKNAGCERMEKDGTVTDWTTRHGAWTGLSLSGKEHPGPRSGKYHFSPSKEGKFAALSQDVDLVKYAGAVDSGGYSVDVSAYIAAYRQRPGDQSQLEVQCLDEDGAVLEGGYASPVEYSAVWRRVGGTFELVPGTRALRVTLKAYRRTGGSRRQKNNNGYFDDVHLMIVRG